MNLLAFTLSSLTQPPFPAITLAIFLVIFFAYVFIAKASANKHNEKEAAKEKVEENTSAPVSDKKATITAVAGTSAGNLELVDTDEKTAAVIMAIVSNKSGIPLERLQFKSITLMED